MMAGRDVQDLNQGPIPGAHDDEAVTVRLVRPPAGPTYIIAIRAALPWVIRRRYLLAEDVE